MIANLHLAAWHAVASRLILHLHYRSGLKHAELNLVAPAVQTMLAWSQFYDCLHLPCLH